MKMKRLIGGTKSIEVIDMHDFALAKAITTLYLDFIERRSEDRELERLETLAQNVTSINYGDDASHGSTKGDRLEKATIELSEYREVMKERRRSRMRDLVDAEAYLWKHLDPLEAHILISEYGRGESVREISQALGLSESWVYRTKQGIKR